MKIIENSNIVQWDNYPDYICAVVLQTNEDITTINGLIMPKGEEIIWLLDKSPKVNGDDVIFSNININCLGGIGFSGDGDIDAELLEIHYKQKPNVKIDVEKYCYA